MTEDQIKLITQVNKDTHFIFDLKPECHSHPCGQVDRNARVQKLSWYAGRHVHEGTVCDVGGKPRRWVGTQYDHFTMPIVDDNDAFRDPPKEGEATYCRCKLPEMCPKCTGHAAYTANDVLYHLKPSDVATVLAQDPDGDFVEGRYLPHPLS